MTNKPLKVPESVAVIGLGYVGLPLACAFGRVMPTLGFDVRKERVDELARGFDTNGDVDPAQLVAPHLRLTSDADGLVNSDVFVVAVPTPVDRAKRPDLSYLEAASRIVGESIARRAARETSPATVVFESTVYPGCTEEVCGPAIERASGLVRGDAFKLGYSPERINPGDPAHTLENIVKIVAGEDPATLALVADLYTRIIRAGVYRAPDIRTAEAAKVIENTQRDLNIALMNELALIFHRLGIDTREVLKAASTKWNFLPFRPGLVGGHCIPEDPYYLTHKAEEVGYHAQVILAGRRINDGMGVWVAQQTIQMLARAGKRLRGARVLMLGITFKENVRDMRHSGAIDIVHELAAYGADVAVHDPVVGAPEVRRRGFTAVEDPFTAAADYDAVVLAVAHRQFTDRSPDAFVRLMRGGADPRVLVDVKGVLPRPDSSQNILYFSL